MNISFHGFGRFRVDRLRLGLFFLFCSVVADDFDHDSCEDEHDARELFLVDLMSEVNDVDHDGHALSGGDDKGSNVLFELFDQLVDHQLPHRVQNGVVEHVPSQLRVLKKESINVVYL